MPFMIGSGVVRANVSAPAGYDIILATGDSNKLFGASLDGALDVADANVVQLGYTSPNTDTVIAGQEPLDYATEGVTATHIGHDAHFAIDYYKANGLLQSPRKVLIVGCAKGGSYAGVDSGFHWGALTGTPGTPTTSTNSLLDVMSGRKTTALALPGTNVIKAVLDLEGSNAYTAYGNNAQLILCHKYRWQLHRKYQYLRNLFGATVPIVISRASTYAIDASSVNFAKNGIIVDGIVRAMASRFPYLAVVDSQSPSALGTGDVHFSAAEQRTLAGRYYTAYLAAQANVARTLTWDVFDYLQSSLGYAAGFTLSNSNRDLSGDANSAWKTALATSPARSGKLYCEVKIQAMANGVNLGFLGFCNADAALDNYLGIASSNDGPSRRSASQWGGLGDNTVIGWTKVWTGNASWTTNDIIQLAVDMTAGKAWIGKNNTWYNSGDPAAGTGEWISGIVDPIYIAASIYTGTGNTYRLQPTAASQTYSPPSGYAAWGQ